MSSPVLSTSPRALVSTAEAQLLMRGVSHMPVMSHDELIGMVCVCDLWEPGVGEQVQARMSAPVVTVSAAATMDEAIEKMREHDVGALPVMVSWRMCGIVTAGDMWRAGVLPPHERPPACRSCGSRHHVRAPGGLDDAAFCRSCTGTPPLDVRALYEDLGGGD